MNRAVRVTLAVLSIAGLASPASSAPIVTGAGAQRHFIWHAGDGSVKTLPNTVEFETVDIPVGPNPFGPNGSDPNVFTPTLPCPNRGGAPGTCPDNRPTVLRLVRDPDSPALDSLYG